MKILKKIEATTVPIQSVGAEELTSASSIRFHVTDVTRPLAAAASVCKAGNRVILDLHDEEGSYIENKVTKERMALHLSANNTFAFNVEYAVTGETGEITLDTGAGASVWPKGLLPEVPLTAKASGLRLVAANGTPITTYGQAVIKFRGIRCDKRPGSRGQGFPRQA